ncbi:MAG: hypothetical protein HND53_06695 [Proteobacteria bacterium]|nr:hypothetical protein [Pseudomonadota bacterium]NOG60172.1 hypothetical protein [Pseudomonadota bacterium]
MERLNSLLLIIAVLPLQACSSKQIHSMIQSNQQNECQTAPNSEYDNCIKHANESYEEYSRNRKEVIEKNADS